MHNSSKKKQLGSSKNSRSAFCYDLQLDSSAEAVFIAEMPGGGAIQLIDANHAWLGLMGLGAELKRGTILNPVETTPDLKAFLRQLQQYLTEHELSDLVDGMRSTYARRRLWTRLIPVCGMDGTLQRLVGITRDITHEKSTETSLERLNRKLRAISDCNQALMRAHDEQTLLVDICRITCEVAGYRMAWVGFSDVGESKLVRPVASLGDEEGYLEKAIISWSEESELSFGPSGKALRSGETQLIKDFSTGPNAAPWEELALSRGYRSTIALPLKDTQGGTYGVFNIYADQVNAFSADECDLLEELAGDLAFGINVLRARREQQRTETERLSNLYFFESMDKVNRAIQGAGDLDRLMRDVLNAVLDIFQCDRAYLLHPCDPDALTWRVPMECNRPAYPGALELGLEIGMTPEVAKTFRLLLQSDGPVQFGPGRLHPVPTDVADNFQVKSFMSLVLYPKVGKPWQFGIHQCSSIRHWSADEERVIHEIGLRLADGLTSVLSFEAHLESEQKLRMAERHFHTLVDNLPDCIARFDGDGHLLYVNPASERTFGFKAEEVIGSNVLDPGPGTKSENIVLSESIKRAFKEGMTNQLESEWSTVKGNRHYDVLHVPERDAEGRVISVLGIAHDITDQKLAEAALRESEERYRRIVDTASEGIWVVNADRVTTFVNARMGIMLGYGVDDMIGRKMSDFLFEEDLSLFEDWDKGVDLNSQKSDERRFRRSDGEVLWALASSSQIVDDSHELHGTITMFTDITERKYQQEQLLYQAHYDPLTGLPNRFLAMDRLDQNIRIAARTGSLTALLFLDLDDFKKVNDALGHEVGDQILILAASRLKQAVRNSDTVARLGGDEFIVLIHDIPDREAVRPVAEKIVEAFQTVFQVMGREVMLTASLGITIYPEDGADPLVLLRNADTAMYHSKAMGRNAYRYFMKSMNLDASRRLLVEEELRLALHREELYLEYQPIVEVSSERVVGAEALLRWHNQILGDVPTPEFIEVAEQTGLIINIGEWVIQQALGDLREWEAWCDNDFHLALNVSPRQFRQVGFVDNLERMLANEKIRGEQLTMEITEGILLSGEVGAAEVIAQLRELGVNISMDDFGTGYSSLSYLRNYHFDTLKIDRVFIRDVISDPNDRELVIATLRMARGLGVRVVAEGVETSEQLGFLRHEKCDYAQGFYLSRPLRAKVFGKMLN
jgi:diguanylate cyclase (GGDEF)-like protein/PAS domain S-box-containing protein